MADDIDAIVEDLTTSGLHLGPGTETWMTEAEVAAVRKALAEADVPVHVVLVRPPEDSNIYAGDDLLARVHDAGGPDGLYVGANSEWAVAEGEPASYPTIPGGREVRPAVQQWGDVAGSPDVARDAESLLVSDADGDAQPLADALLSLVRHLDDGTYEAAAAAASDGRSARYEAERESGGSTGSSTSYADEGDTSDAVVGGVTVLVLLAALGLGAAAVGRRVRARRGARTFALPDSVLDRVREAGDAELARRARADVLALGERIDAADLGGSGASAWAAALDHYDAAGRLLPDEPTAEVDPLDAVGAVVLAGRGEEALAAARRGRPFEPSTRCFLNPLHGRASRDHALEHDGRRVEAPICAACRRDLQAGRRPDILEVVVRGRPQHYFETDREPWASTGFGALEPDLVRRLHRGGRR
ncbi:hypothetical protein AB0N29_13595 [Nocardioides sp. NPDC092400]|uniref:hypothetical protein n=1 Tax=Nocardioides sp. NPDC092400 TaxID=3155196 RepID=UPI00344768DB